MYRISIILVLSFVHYSRGIEWKQGDGAVWAENCDFNENNLDKENIKGEDCGRRCLDTNDCTHFSYFDGWCYKKSGAVQKSNAFYKSGVYCGIVERNTNKEIVWQQGDKAVWAENCDFNENNLDKENIKGEDCGRRCLDTNDCTHFSYFDGWCYKKSGAVQKSNAFYKSGVYCGIVDRILNPVEKINYPLYHMTDIRVKVRNPQGGVSIEVDIDTIEYSGHHDYIKRITLKDGHVTTKRGWRNMFTNTDKHTVMIGSVVKVDMSENGLLGKWQRGKIVEKVSGLGFFKYEKEDLYLEFRIQERL